jgi:hypothetical protein
MVLHAGEVQPRPTMNPAGIRPHVGGPARLSRRGLQSLKAPFWFHLLSWLSAPRERQCTYVGLFAKGPIGADRDLPARLMTGYEHNRGHRRRRALHG